MIDERQQEIVVGFLMTRLIVTRSVRALGVASLVLTAFSLWMLVRG